MNKLRGFTGLSTVTPGKPVKCASEAIGCNLVCVATNFREPRFAAAVLCRFGTRRYSPLVSGANFSPLRMLARERSRMPPGLIHPEALEPGQSGFRKNARHPIKSERSRCGNRGRERKDRAGSVP